MKIILVGRYNSSEKLTGPEKVAKRLFSELVKIYENTCFVEYFFDGKRYNFRKKLFGKEKISVKMNSFRFGLIAFFIFLIKYKPDVIHIVKLERFQIVIFLYRLLFHVKILFTVNGIAAHENIYCNNSPGFIYKLKDRVLESLIYRYSNYLVFLSNRSKNLAKKYFNIAEAKVKIIPNGIDDIFFENYYEKRNGSVIKVVFVGSYSRQEKGLSILLDILKKSDVKIEVHIVSDETSSLDHSDSNLTLVWHAKFSTEDYAAFLSDKEIFVSASKYESFSISAAEGVASGLIPFFTLETGLSEVISHTKCGYYFPFEELTKINEYLLSFSENREEHIKRKDALYEVIAQLTWPNIAQEYAQLYKNSED